MHRALPTTQQGKQRNCTKTRGKRGPTGSSGTAVRIYKKKDGRGFGSKGAAAKLFTLDLQLHVPDALLELDHGRGEHLLLPLQRLLPLRLPHQGGADLGQLRLGPVGAEGGGGGLGLAWRAGGDRGGVVGHGEGRFGFLRTRILLTGSGLLLL